MGRSSLAEDMVLTFSKLPWWANILLAVISYSVLHKLAMSFYDPAPKIEIGAMGDHVASKMPGAIALFAQFLIPFCFVLGGLIGVINKWKTTGQYKELILYIVINLLFFGPMIAKEGGIHNSMKNRVSPPVKKENIKNEGEKIYSWENEKGQKVYSNKPQQ